MRKKNPNKPELNNDLIKPQTKRRKKGKNCLPILLYICIFIGALIYGLVFMFTSDYFKIKNYTVKGCVYCNKKPIDSLADELIGKNIFLMNKMIFAARSSKQNEIDYITIDKQFPDRLEIRVYEIKPALCFSTPSGKYLSDENGNFFHKIKDGEKLTGFPTVIHSTDNIRTGNNINSINDFQTEFLYDLARCIYKNHLDIRSVEIKNKFQVIMYTNNGILIKYGATADITDKIYLLVHIFRTKKSIINKIKEIYIIDKETATYKLRAETNEKI